MTGDPEASTDADPEQDTRATAVSRIHDRALASPLTPLVTAPLNVERAPRASGGPAALAVAINDTLRKAGAVRGLRLLRRANQPEGFACPGCAWPRGETGPRLAVCESGVRAIVDELGPREAGPQLFATYTIPELARRSDHWLSAQGRLTHPMVRRPHANAYEPIAWAEAVELIAARLRALPSPDRAGFYTSGRVANESAFCVQLLARALGTNNLASSNQLCHEASRVAMRSVLGSRRSPVGLADFDATEAIFVFGQNPGSNHPRMLESLRAAKLRGASIVAINPLREVSLVRVRDPRQPRDWLGPGTAIADLHLSVRVGGDLAVIEAMSKAVIEAGAVDREFVRAHTDGWAALEAALAERSWTALAERSGVAEPELRAAAEIYASSRATMVCWGAGLTQHRDGVATIEQLLALLLLRGNLGKPGAGPLAALGHANTAGLWTMGVDARPSEARLAALERATGLELSRAPGLDAGELLAAMRRGEIDVLLGLGGNLLSAAPDTERAAEGLRRCGLSVQLATKLNRSHLITGETGLLLPCLARSEQWWADGRLQWVSFEDACGTVHASQGHEPAIADSLRSEPAILADIGAACFADQPDRRAAIDWPALGRDLGEVRRLIAASVPGCEAFATTLGPAAPVQLERPAAGLRFLTETGKAQLRVPPRPSELDAGDGDGALWLTSVRSHDQHGSNIYWAGDRERGIHGYRRIALMNLDDMRARAVEPYTQIDLISEFDGERRRADKWVAVPHHVAPGCVAVYFPEANVLVPASAIDPRSGTPSYKSVRVTIAGAGCSVIDRDRASE